MQNLHSTIFILKLIMGLAQIIKQLFTFYYIYIKTMALANSFKVSMLFTFYYIYIKTSDHETRITVLEHLHSTIFILKLYSPRQDLSNYYIYILLYCMCQVNVGNFFIFFSNPLNAIAFNTLFIF